MRHFSAILFAFVSLLGTAAAQTKSVLKTISTDQLTEGFSVKTGTTLTIPVGATINNLGTATGFGSGLTIDTSAITGGTSGNVLYNNAGVLGEKTTTGNGSVVLSTAPSLSASMLITANSGTAGTLLLRDPTNVNNSKIRAGALTAARTLTTPDVDGAIVSTGDTGTVTNAMLAGSIDLTTKVTGTLPVANGGTGITSLGTGVATFLGTPTLANFNAATTDADAFSTTSALGASQLGANTWTGIQTLPAGSVSAPALTHGDSTSGWYRPTTNAVALTTSGKIRWDLEGGYMYWFADGAYTGTGVICRVDCSGSYSSFDMGRDRSFGWMNDLVGTAARDVSLNRGGAGILELKNSTSAQTFRIYGTTTGSKYLSLAHDGTNAVISASSGSLTIVVGGSTRVTVNSSGEVFLNLPTSAGTSGSLWNDTGTVKVAP